MTAELIDKARRLWSFRAQRAGEGDRTYLAALIAHVEARDFSMAHELRVGRPQAEWTTADVEAFRAHVFGKPGPSDEFSPGVHAIPVMTAGTFPVTLESLLALVTRAIDERMTFRREHPTEDMVMLVNVLLDSGTLLVALPARGERIALLKGIARQQPVFGFFLVADAFIHAINQTTQTASKSDALIIHVGTRDFRCVKVRPYKVLPEGFVAFEDPPPPDIDEPTLRGGIDPYASIFVSVPSPERVQ